MSDVTPPETDRTDSDLHPVDRAAPGTDRAPSDQDPATGGDQEDAVGPPAVLLYWRPGCGFCSSLTRNLDRIGLDYDAHNIWEDEDAAVFVRSVANGNETVPTVRIGDVALVNPTADEVMAEVTTIAPTRVPADYEPPEPGALGRALRRMLGG